MILKNYKKYFYMISLLMLVCFIIIGWRYLTHGFRAYKILGSMPFEDFKITTNIADEKLALTILDQKFSYMNKGAQAFVFQSDDNRYVIKFLALNKYKEPFRRQVLSFFSIFKEHRNERIFNRERNFKASLNSYKLVYENLKKETGVIYVHLKENEKFKNKITIIDKLGFSYKIDPNQTLFIIQKKAEKIKPYLLQYAKKNDFDELKKIISVYFAMTKNVIKKNIINRDSSIKNSGISEDGFIEVDIGRFQKITDTKENYTKYLQKYTRLYRKFLKSYIPEIVEYFDEKIKEQNDDNG